MKQLQLRAAGADDLPALAALLNRPIGLPAGAHEHLLLVQGTPAEGGPPQLLATLRLLPAVGLETPRLWYHVGTTVHAAPELGLFHRQRTLLLGHDHTGASELADIAVVDEDLALDLRGAALRLLVHGAWLLIARHRAAYAPQVIVELPGLRDSAGQSPFWHGLGRHFYTGDPAAAAAEHGPAWRSLVAALLPRQLLYASFLPPAAQAAIGQADPAALLLREVLEDAGLRYSHHVNLEDAGPVLTAAMDDLPGLSAARSHRVQALDPLATGAEARWVLAGTDAAPTALRTWARVEGDKLALPAEALEALGLLPGDVAWTLPPVRPC